MHRDASFASLIGTRLGRRLVSEILNSATMCLALIRDALIAKPFKTRSERSSFSVAPHYTRAERIDRLQSRRQLIFPRSKRPSVRAGVTNHLSDACIS